MSNILIADKDTNVRLIGAMPRESFADIAATFTRTEKGMDETVSMPYNEELVKKLVDMNHLATTEFDFFVFAVEGFSRTCEVQLVRKRIASYLIKSGRPNKNGNRSFDVVMPQSLSDFYAPIKITPGSILVDDSQNLESLIGRKRTLEMDLTFKDLMDIIEQWYDAGVKAKLPEEDLRYAKPQGTEFKGLIGMNAHALIDWFKIRCCRNAQHEMQTLANSMLRLSKEHSPALFKNAGASCVSLGYCPENTFQNEKCKGKIITHDKVKELIINYKNTPIQHTSIINTNGPHF